MQNASQELPSRSVRRMQVKGPIKMENKPANGSSPAVLAAPQRRSGEKEMMARPKSRDKQNGSHENVLAPYRSPREREALYAKSREQGL